jgi:hypothetical protein
MSSVIEPLEKQCKIGTSRIPGSGGKKDLRSFGYQSTKCTMYDCKTLLFDSRSSLSEPKKNS